MTTIPQIDAGVASFNTESFKDIPLFSGPATTITTSETVAAATIAAADLPANAVVGRNSSGELVMAKIGNVDPDDDIHPIGVTVNTVKMGATVKTVAVRRDGMFNPNVLVWDASYNTAAKKRLAFETSQPTIFIREPMYPQP